MAFAACLCAEGCYCSSAFGNVQVSVARPDNGCQNSISPAVAHHLLMRDIRNPDANTFTAEWVRVIPFSEGIQTILVTLPF